MERRASAASATPKQSDLKREGKWRLAFGRLASGGQLRRESLLRAMEMSGFQHIIREWVDEVYEGITMVSSLTSAEYVKFLRGYEAHKQNQYIKAFEAADEDQSGQLDVSELSQVLDSLGWTSSPELISEVVEEVDEDRSGLVSLDEFLDLMGLLGNTMGFTRKEREDLHEIFGRFAAEGDIPIDRLHAALAFLGYTRSEKEVRELAASVDLDGGGCLSAREFVVFMRFVINAEVAQLREVFLEQDADESGFLELEELEEVLRRVGFFPDREAVMEIASDLGISDALTFDAMLLLLRAYRDREGLTRKDLIGIGEAYERYATPGEELSQVEVGRVLRWLGYTNLPFEKQQLLVQKVDADASGKLGLEEVTKLVRMLVEEQIRSFHVAFQLQDQSRRGSVSMQQASQAWSWLRDRGQAPPDEMSAFSGEERDISLGEFVQIGVAFMKQHRVKMRENGGVSEAQAQQMIKMFEEYDDDASGSISFKELGRLIRGMFSVITESMRPKLDAMMREVDTNGRGSLDFQDFKLIIKQFLDLRDEELAEKERRAVESTSFSPGEVKEFRELFNQLDEDGDCVLEWVEVKKLVGKICGASGRSPKEVLRAFQESQLRKATGCDHSANQHGLDFPEFLMLMSSLSSMGGEDSTASRRG